MSVDRYRPHVVTWERHQKILQRLYNSAILQRSHEELNVSMDDTAEESGSCEDGCEVSTNWVLCRPDQVAVNVDDALLMPPIAETEEDGEGGRIRKPSIRSAACECSAPDALSKIDCECAVHTKEVIISVDDPSLQAPAPGTPREASRSTPRSGVRGPHTRRQTKHPSGHHLSRTPAHNQTMPPGDGVARVQTHGNDYYASQATQSSSVQGTRERSDPTTLEAPRSRRHGAGNDHGPSQSSAAYDISEMDFTITQNGNGEGGLGTCNCGNTNVNEGFVYDEPAPTRLRGGGVSRHETDGVDGRKPRRSHSIEEPLVRDEPMQAGPSTPSAVAQTAGYRMSMGGYHEGSGDVSPAITDSDTTGLHKRSPTDTAAKAPTPSTSTTIEKKSRTKGRSKLNKSGSDSSLDEDSKWLAWIEVQFQKIAGADGQIDLSEFKRALGVKESFFAERFFSIFDEDKSGSIEMAELMGGLRIMTKGTRLQKLKFLFDVYDVDGSGSIDRDELKTVLKSCVGESSMSLSEEDLQDLTDALFDDADEDGSGAITFDELVDELKKYPEVMDNLTISAANWLKPPAPKKKKPKKPMLRYFTKAYIMNNLRKVIFLLVLAIINLGLSALSVYRYWDSNIYVIIARVCGMCLNFNCTFILVLMLRYSLTWLRTTPLGKYLPLDQTIMLHKLLGYLIFVQSLIHTGAHLVNIYVMVDEAQDILADAANATTTVMATDVTSMDNSTWMTTETPVTTTAAHPFLGLGYLDVLFTLQSKIGYIGPGFGYLSGDVLIIILFIMVVGSMEFVRRGGFFMVFYWTHMLYILFWGFLITHGPIFWMFFVGPGIIFIVERVYMSKLFKVAKYGHTYIKEVTLLPSRVTHIAVARPKNFKYQPGDYIFINIPKVATQEWHPFTISSSPEREDAIWVHIRAVGHWTTMLYEFFEQYQSLDEMEQKSEKAAIAYAAKNKRLSSILTPEQLAAGKQRRPSRKGRGKGKGKVKKVKVEIYLDGPYGTSTREIFEAEHAVLIGTGIGVTPYASILQSISHRYKQLHRSCPKCEHHWYDDSMSKDIMKIKCVDFVWVNREQNCFDCFVSLLSEIELDQGKDPEFAEFLEMQMWMTSALDKSDMKAVGLQMAIEILHKKQNKDVVTGLKTRTQPGRPDWREVFAKIKAKKKGQVSVFFCGAPGLSRTLKEQCNNFGFTFAKENF